MILIKRIKNIVVLFVLVFFTFLSCTRKQNDYRYKYIGAWEFLTVTSHFNMGDSTSGIDSTTYLGYINLGELENEIHIKYSDTESMDVEIDQDGKMVFTSSYFRGEFVSESEMTFYYSWGGMGGGGSFSLTGEK